MALHAGAFRITPSNGRAISAGMRSAHAATDSPAPSLGGDLAARLERG